MQVQYIGPFSAGVEIAATAQVVPRGGVVEVPDMLGIGLCEQTDNWAAHGDESIDFFVRFCQWVAAVRTAEAEAAVAGGDVDEAQLIAAGTSAPLGNPALDRLNALTADTVAVPAASPIEPQRRRRGSTDAGALPAESSEEG